MFTGKLKITAGISIAIIVIGIIVSAVFGGLNLGIDFTGGSLVVVDMKGEYDVDVIRDVLTNNGVQDAPIVKAGDGYTQAQIRLQDGGDDEQIAAVAEAITADINATYPEAELISIDRVGGVTSTEMVRNALLAVVVACVLMLVYIWIRFELYSGIAAVIALVQDVMIMLSFVAIFQLQVNSGFIAACLTIVGYSINNTIVVFDRIRDNRKVLEGKKYSKYQIADISVKETLTRTLNTSVTTLIMIVCLYIFGVDSIKEFALPIIVGLLAGTYSSIFLSAPIWALIANKFENRSKQGGKKKKKSSTKNKTAKA